MCRQEVLASKNLTDNRTTDSAFSYAVGNSQRIAAYSLVHIGHILHFFTDTLSYLPEPCSGIRAMDDARQKSQAFADVVTISPDIFLGGPSV